MSVLLLTCQLDNWVFGIKIIIKTYEFHPICYDKFSLHNQLACCSYYIEYPFWQKIEKYSILEKLLVFLTISILLLFSYTLLLYVFVAHLTQIFSFLFSFYSIYVFILITPLSACQSFCRILFILLKLLNGTLNLVNVKLCGEGLSFEFKVLKGFNSNESLFKIITPKRLSLTVYNIFKAVASFSALDVFH